MLLTIDGHFGDAIGRDACGRRNLFDIRCDGSWNATVELTGTGVARAAEIRLSSMGTDLVLISGPVHPAAEPLDVPGLTPAEREVALLAAQGLSNVRIAQRRGSAPRTVANQLASAYRKLGLTSRRELRARLRDRR